MYKTVFLVGGLEDLLKLSGSTDRSVKHGVLHLAPPPPMLPAVCTVYEWKVSEFRVLLTFWHLPFVTQIVVPRAPWFIFPLILLNYVVCFLIKKLTFCFS